MIKKLIPIMLALVAIFCTTQMRGDTPPDRPVEVPIRKPGAHDLVRSLCEIQAYYNGMLSVVCTSVLADLGEIDIAVTNCTTGEFWQDTFESYGCMQHVLSVSGTPGLYEVTYTVESGGQYYGTFMIE